MRLRNADPDRLRYTPTDSVIEESTFGDADSLPGDMDIWSARLARNKRRQRRRRRLAACAAAALPLLLCLLLGVQFYSGWP